MNEFIRDYNNSELEEKVMSLRSPQLFDLMELRFGVELDHDKEDWFEYLGTYENRIYYLNNHNKIVSVGKRSYKTFHDIPRLMRRKS